MPLSFPLSVADFLQALPIQSIEFDLPEVAISSRTEGGEVLTDTTGVRLWQGTVTLGRMPRQEAREAIALIRVMQGAEASFLACPLATPFPKNDPAGAIVTAHIQAGFTPQVRLVNPTAANLISLRNLPAGLVFARGDYLSFQYATGPVRFAFHQIVEETVETDASGLTPNMEIRPHLQPGWQVGDIAQITFPRCKAKILPGTVQLGRTTRFVTEGVTFQFQQTLR